MFFTIGDKTNQGIRQFFKYTGAAFTDTTLGNMATTLNAAMVNASGPIEQMHESVTYTGCLLEDLTSATSAVAELSASTSGSLTGTQNPAAACVVQSLEIARRYRGGHPRTYWPMGDAGLLQTPDTWEAAAVTAFTARLQYFADQLIGTAFGSTTIANQVNVNYYKGFTVVTNPITGRSRNVPTLLVTPNVDIISSFITRSYVGSMRRRRDKTSTS